MNNYSEQIKACIEEFNLLHSKDPNKVSYNGEETPFALAFHTWLSDYVISLSKKEPSMALVLASYSQHLLRYSVPRETYGEGKKEYYQWRNDLKKIQFDKAKEILVKNNISQEIIDQVGLIIHKKDLKNNSDAQLMEDALCLVFLTYQFSDFIKSGKYSEEKIVGIIKKTWGKMSEAAHDKALQLPFSETEASLVKKAIL